MPVIRDPITGRFLSKAAAKARGLITKKLPDRNLAENYLRSVLGRRPGGGTWYSIAKLYPDRFADYLADAEREAA